MLVSGHHFLKKLVAVLYVILCHFENDFGAFNVIRNNFFPSKLRLFKERSTEGLILIIHNRLREPPHQQNFYISTSTA